MNNNVGIPERVVSEISISSSNGTEILKGFVVLDLYEADGSRTMVIRRPSDLLEVERNN